MTSRGACRRVLKLRLLWEGSLGKPATAANRTREIRPSGMRGGAEQKRERWWNCEPAAPIERVRLGNPPPKVARAALLPDDLGFGIQA